MPKHHLLPATRHSFNEIFSNFARDFFAPMLHDEPGEGFTPKIEVRETIKRFVVSAELPGIHENDITISLDGRNLILQGKKENQSEEEEQGFYHSEFSYGSFYRSIPLTEAVDENNVEAVVKNGVLKINLFKKEDSAERGKKIPIKKELS